MIAERIWLLRELMCHCWRESRCQTSVVAILMIVEIATFAVVGLGLRELVDGAENGDSYGVILGALQAGLAYAATHIMTRVRSNLRIHLAERIGLTRVDMDILRLTGSVEGIEHIERSDYLGRIALLRGAGAKIVDWAFAMLESVMYFLQFLISMALLATISSWSLVLVPATVIPLWLNHIGQRKGRANELAAAEPVRLQRHLFQLCTEAEAAGEIRISGAGHELLSRQAVSWRRAVDFRARAQLTTAAFTMVGWGLFTTSYIGCLILITQMVAAGRGTTGDIVMAVTLATQLRAQIESVVMRTTQVIGNGMTTEHYLWLRQYAATATNATSGTLDSPPVLRDGIDIKNLSFTYPGANSPAIDNVDLRLAAGTVVALVGEYGSGKTTLVKLLTKLYRGTGTITVDGVDLADIDTVRWRSRLSAVFQDFGRYKTTLSEAIGLGDVAHLADRSRIVAAVVAANVAELVDQLPAGLDTRLGIGFRGGTGLSEGQWQKLALARGYMRTSPVMLILDEPTASLDPPSEAAIFRAYAARAREVARDTGAVTLIVTHRFSTIAMADQIVVMSGGRIVESGDHEMLLDRGGTYAELYGLQKQAYVRGATVGGAECSDQ